MKKSEKALKSVISRRTSDNEDTSVMVLTNPPELNSQLLLLLKTIKQQTSCSHCGLFTFQKKGSALNPFLLLEESQDFSEKIKANWRRIGDEIIAERKSKLVKDKEPFLFVPLKMDDQTIGLLASSFPRLDNESLNEKGDLTMRWGEVIRTILESSHENKKTRPTQFFLSTLNNELSRLKALKEIADGVAHDINNPLQVILGKTQILLMNASKDPGGQKLMEELRIIEKNANRISALVKELYDFVKSTQSDVESKSDVDLNYLLNRTLALVKNRFKGKGIELDFQTPEDLPSIWGNFSSLQQAFLDLMLNAQEAMPQGGKFSVRLERKDDFVQLQFEDTGEKIPEDLLSKVFDPSLIHPELKRKIGWGLYSVGQIIKKHQGEIEVKGGEDGGAIFSIKLPLV